MKVLYLAEVLKFLKSKKLKSLCFQTVGQLANLYFISAEVLNYNNKVKSFLSSPEGKYLYEDYESIVEANSDAKLVIFIVGAFQGASLLL